MKHYAQVQFVGFIIGTHTKSRISARREFYKGLDDDYLDLTHRINIVKNCIEIATNQPHINHSTDVLKILMFPEFLFQGVRGAYDYNAIIRVFEEFRLFLSDPKYLNWMFVLGTVVGAMPVNPELRTDVEILNVAVVIIGGSLNPDLSTLIYKEFASPIDYIDEHIAVDAGERIKVQGTAGSRSTGVLPTIPCEETQKSGVSLGGEGYFYFKSLIHIPLPILFGLEVCLDHSFGRLRASWPRARWAHYPQIHLLTADGASINTNGIVAGHNGYIFKVDSETGIACGRNIGTYQESEFEIVKILNVFRIDNPALLRELDAFYSGSNAFGAVFHTMPLDDAEPIRI